METIVSLRNFVNGCILEGHQRLAGAFHAIMNNREADIYFKMKRSGIENESSYIKILFQKDFSYKCQFCIKVYVHLQGWSLKFGRNIKKFQVNY